MVVNRDRGDIKTPVANALGTLRHRIIAFPFFEPFLSHIVGLVVSRGVRKRCGFVLAVLRFGYGCMGPKRLSTRIYCLFFRLRAVSSNVGALAGIRLRSFGPSGSGRRNPAGCDIRAEQRCDKRRRTTVTRQRRALVICFIRTLNDDRGRESGPCRRSAPDSVKCRYSRIWRAAR